MSSSDISSTNPLSALAPFLSEPLSQIDQLHPRHFKALNSKELYKVQAILKKSFEKSVRTKTFQTAAEKMGDLGFKFCHLIPFRKSKF